MDKRGREALKKVRRKFDKINALGAISTPESRKASRSMSDLWKNRVPTDTAGFRRPQPR